MKNKNKIELKKYRLKKKKVKNNNKITKIWTKILIKTKCKNKN